MSCIKITYITFLISQFMYRIIGENFFRNDYTFLEDTQSFYKIHTIGRTWQDAKKLCAYEGGYFFYPEDNSETTVVIDYWNRSQPFSTIYIGVSSLLAKGVFESVEGKPISDIYNKWSPGEPNDADGEEDCVVLSLDGVLSDSRCDKRQPFICKKTLASLEWNTFCNTPLKDYMFSANIGKCYKFHTTPMKWTEAYAVCNTEQSYLAVINSKEEAKYLVNLTANAPIENVRRIYLNGEVYLGFHNRDGEGWTTLKGTSLEDSGYAEWGHQQPDGGEHETCGTMFYDGLLNDQNCEQKAFFICERDVGLLALLMDLKG